MLAAGALAVVVLVVAAGYGYAAITATSNVYTGCLKAGQIYNVAIGTAPAGSCVKPAVQISWSQTGPPGQNGAPGQNGTNGTNGTNGKDGVSVTSATEPAGANCADGGSKFTAANGVTYACNGAKGDKGDQGEKGDPGDSGVPNLEALDGNDSLADSGSSRAAHKPAN
jgi:hypothetical protein